MGGNGVSNKAGPGMNWSLSRGYSSEETLEVSPEKELVLLGLFGVKNRARKA